MSWTAASAGAEMTPPPHQEQRPGDAAPDAEQARLPVLHIICGPTAAGKSALAMRLAAVHPVTIISADSRQVYRGFDIGTAKPSPADRSLVPHRGLDVIDPGERYTAARWAESAGRWVHDASREGRTPIIVGGTGLYLRALLRPLFTEPPLDPGRRAALQRELAELDPARLRAWVQELDPARAHLGRAQLLRAVEVAMLTGQRISELHRASTAAARFAARILVVDPGGKLHARIAARIDRMCRAGWEDEVRALARSVPQEAPAWNATGYRAMRALVEGRASRAAALERVLVDTRQYAKRQRTWFRHQLVGSHVTRLDPTAPDVTARLASWWHGGGSLHGDAMIEPEARQR